MTNEILKKFLNNSCTVAELDEIIQWANKEAYTAEGKSKMLLEWNKYSEEENLMDDEKFSILFDKIQQRIDSESSKNKNAVRGISTMTLVATWLTRAAAIFLIPVLVFLFYTLSEKKFESVKYAGLALDSLEIVAPIGSRTVVHLSDGSEVHLNYGSKLKYPQFFSGATRGVQLSGEGYFNIAPNPEKPFIVSAGKMNVKALGTSFNVSAYPNEDIVETTLVNGKVTLERNEISGKAKLIGIMAPGQHVNYSIKTGEVSGTNGNVEKYIGWKDGKLIFEDATMTQVAEKLTRMFNADIEISDDIKDYLYTVTFVDEPLFQILDLMTIATPVRCKIFPREKMPDGTFSKQKIIIEKKTINTKT